MAQVVSKLKKLLPGLAGLPLILVLGVALLAAGFYTVDSGEEAVILRFGQHVSTITVSGLKWRIPLVDTVWKEQVSEVKRLEFGFRTMRQGSSHGTPEYREVPSESLMLTGDENLVNVESIVQFRIVDIEKYFFQVDDPVATLRVAAEATVRRVIANHPLDAALTDNKSGIQQEIKDDLQLLCDLYNLGVAITAVQLQDVYPPNEVDAAFKDVASAREDRNAYINQAQAYANEVIPRARGNAAEMLNKAEGYRQRRIAEAQGDVAMFNAILMEYRQGREVTRVRLYLETLEKILPGIEKVIVDEQGNSVKLLPLTGLEGIR